MSSTPYTVALTGGIASGKSTVAQWFAQQDVPIIDADVIARQLVAPHQPALTGIVQHFGQKILTEKGELNRPALRAHIFQHPNDKAWLETYLHPIIRQTMIDELVNTQYSKPLKHHYAIAVIPLLQETGIPSYVNRVLVIDCSVETQLERLVKRDGIDEQLARSMIQQQASRTERLAIADDIIDNNSTTEQSLREDWCMKLHRNYTLLAIQQGFNI